jgi:hypothetical protein
MEKEYNAQMSSRVKTEFNAKTNETKRFTGAKARTTRPRPG